VKYAIEPATGNPSHQRRVATSSTSQPNHAVQERSEWSLRTTPSRIKSDDRVLRASASCVGELTSTACDRNCGRHQVAGVRSSCG
jgi:hypothetical protein